MPSGGGIFFDIWSLCILLCSASVPNLQNSSFSIQNSSCLIQNSSFLIQSSSVFLTYPKYVAYTAALLECSAKFIILNTQFLVCDTQILIVVWFWYKISRFQYKITSNWAICSSVPIFLSLSLQKSSSINADFLGFDTQCLVFHTKFIIFSHLAL